MAKFFVLHLLNYLFITDLFSYQYPRSRHVKSYNKNLKNIQIMRFILLGASLFLIIVGIIDLASILILSFYGKPIPSILPQTLTLVLGYMSGILVSFIRKYYDIDNDIEI